MAISSKQIESVLWVVIDREAVLNALDIPHLESLVDLFKGNATREETRCVVITGKGRAFSVGADIKAMDIMTDIEFAQAAELYQELCRVMRALEKPIIAAINGYALGGGLEVALMADVRIASQSARLGLPDAELGFSPTGGLTYLLNHIVGAGWAMHMAMTAEIFDAEKSFATGLITQIVDDTELESTTLALATKLAAFPPVGMKNIKHSFNTALEANLASTLELEAKYDSECYQSPETRQALKAFIDSRRK